MTRQGQRIQKEVLVILRRHLIPRSAYDVLGELRQISPKIAPPTVYRALAALTQRGRVHRLESLNAFIACQCDQHQNASILSICDDCGTVEESVAPDLVEELSGIAGQSGFAPTRHVIEVHGLCASCGTGDIPA
ncbi:MAG: Fur family transcriptional regulator [Albidovulum sp.]|nr:Fur family transcriptional regulator [Albidovulum sp.]MDE0303854.1 Fur family transcriptional regulator [Albidovulum sp.]MDE0532711.1 Fur family transcriptional regulator [Albidovulum sp.]